MAARFQWIVVRRFNGWRLGRSANVPPSTRRARMSREGEMWRWSTTVPGLAVLCAFPPPAAGQAPNLWRWSVAPYLWASSIKGRTGVPPLVSDVEQNKRAFAVLVEARPARWRLGLD